MRLITCLAVLFLGACATAGHSDHATLLFEQPPVQGLPGGILGVGKVDDFKGSKSVRVEPGKRRVYYRCPGVLVMDEQLHLRATFEPGAVYVLECTGADAVVRRKDSPE